MFFFFKFGVMANRTIENHAILQLIWAPGRVINFKREYTKLLITYTVSVINFAGGKFHELSCGGNFHDNTSITFIKSYRFSFRVGKIFAKTEKSRKTQKLPPREISTFTVLGIAISSYWLFSIFKRHIYFLNSLFDIRGPSYNTILSWFFLICLWHGQ